jgi:ATP-dependent RNA helicase RhlE
VNFDLPETSDDYVHRVGRTARAEAKGDAFLFVAPEEEAKLRVIERALGRRLPRIHLDGFDYAKKPVAALEAQERRSPWRKARPAHAHARARTRHASWSGR